MQWWCSAQGIAWSWSWRPYAGVWLLVLALVWWYWRSYRRAARETNGVRAPLERGRLIAGLAGILSLWIALDWPVGTLGSGYLASVHMVQFLLIAMIAPALLLAGWPPATADALSGNGSYHRFARALTHPIVALVLFDLIVVVTHAPPVVDSLMGSQLGSFVLDMAWLVAGLLFWQPVIGGAAGGIGVWRRPSLRTPMNIGYLFVGSLAHTGVAMYLLLSRFPVYSTYELAPPIPGISPKADQEIAGGLMLIVGMAIVLGAISVIFFRWQSEMELENRGVPARGGE